MRKEELTERIIAAAIEVHREIGPGLLESAYEECFCRELASRGIRYERQRELPIVHKGFDTGFRYRVDLVVEGSVIVELKSVDAVIKVHEAQILSYMRMSGIDVGLPLNFNVDVLKKGIKRFVL